jgi:hypothetical protein
MSGEEFGQVIFRINEAMGDFKKYSDKFMPVLLRILNDVNYVDSGDSGWSKEMADRWFIAMRKTLCELSYEDVNFDETPPRMAVGEGSKWMYVDELYKEKMGLNK